MPRSASENIKFRNGQYHHELRQHKTKRRDAFESHVIVMRYKSINQTYIRQKVLYDGRLFWFII